MFATIMQNRLVAFLNLWFKKFTTILYFFLFIYKKFTKFPCVRNISISQHKISLSM